MELKLRYNKPAPDSADGWEQYSMPIGCSYMGGNVFGGVDYERIQITENSAENDKQGGGLNSFADIYLRFGQAFEDASNYERGLDISRGLAYVHYDIGGVHIEREYFASYPDRAVVGRVASSSPVSYGIALQIPYLNEEEGRQKRGKVESNGTSVVMSGVMCHYNVRFYAKLGVYSDGDVTAKDGMLYISGAKETYFIFCGATNYELRPEVFTEPGPKKKLRDFDPCDTVHTIFDSAAAHSYDELKERHIADYTGLFGRVELDLGEADVPGMMTDELLEAYRNGDRSRYLEVLYFQYGRYLLISSSRPGCLPTTLQGVWNCHDRSPWGSGYWHNINVQMNYWPAFITNLAETFEAYSSFNEAFRPAAEVFAANYIKNTVPERYTDEPGACGWTIGTASYAYTISGPGGCGGPGTCGLTTKMFWDAYAFTADKKILIEKTYPALLSVAKYLTKAVRNYDGQYLSVFSASPEQIITNEWNPERDTQYHLTVGCAFDQQMIWENGRDLLRCIEMIGEENIPEKDLPTIRELREQIDRYDPVQVGWSGQIKEYREENFYGEIGEYRHRHISQLVGLYPGTSIGSESPAWLDAAKVTLNFRSDHSTGWALAHRLNAWARTGDGNRAYKLYSNLLGTRTLPNLWDTHPPFQIDGNFGGTSGVAEMLLQSHEKYITPLASLPDEWANGSFKGLAARGGFVLDVHWINGCADTMTVYSKNDHICRIKYPGISHAKTDFPVSVIDENRIEFAAESGKFYTFANIPAWEKKKVPEKIRVNRDLILNWDFDEPVNIWRAIDSSPTYDLIAAHVSEKSYRDVSCRFENTETITYKITRADTLDASSEGAYATLNHSTEADRQRYRYYIRQINMPCGGADLPDYLGE